MSRERETDPRDLTFAVCRSTGPLFQVGSLVITARALETLDRLSWMKGLYRHLSGDWGELGDEDRHANDEALATGNRLLSSYKDSCGCTFWIITEADRSATTILMPEEY